MGDGAKLAEAIREATRRRIPISDAAARVLASMWHSGQGSLTYSFVSTGRIAVDDSGNARGADILRELFGPKIARQDERAAFEMTVYLADRQDKRRLGPVPGWSKLWL